MENVENISEFSGTARIISFPCGKPPKGTCEFATNNCLKECGERLPNFLSEHKTYKLFCELSISELISKLSVEIKESQNKMLAWFPESGDCTKNLTNKILEVIRGLQVPQNGFTRNRELWESSQNIPNVHIVLTEENGKIVNLLKNKGLIGVPDYYERRVKILKADTIWICGDGSVTCGCGSVEIEGDVSEEDCGLCSRHLRGCYAA